MPTIARTILPALFLLTPTAHAEDLQNRGNDPFFKSRPRLPSAPNRPGRA